MSHAFISPAVGVYPRAVLSSNIADAYMLKNAPLCMAALDIAFNNLKLTEHKMERGEIEWEHLQIVRGQTNALVDGVTQAMLMRNHWSIEFFAKWKEWHSPVWTVVQEPEYLKKVGEELGKHVLSLIDFHFPISRPIRRALQQYVDVPPRLKDSAQLAVTRALQSIAGTPEVWLGNALPHLLGIDSQPNYEWIRPLLKATPTMRGELNALLQEQLRNVQHQWAELEELDKLAEQHQLVVLG